MSAPQTSSRLDSQIDGRNQVIMTCDGIKNRQSVLFSHCDGGHMLLTTDVEVGRKVVELILHQVKLTDQLRRPS